MADDHDLVGVELGPAGADGPVVAEGLVAVQFDELVEDQFQVVGRHGPVGMPGDLDRFPGLQLAVDLLLQVGQLAAAGGGFHCGPRASAATTAFQFLDTGFQLVDRPLERQAMRAFSHLVYLNLCV